jgi:putative endonuclease
MAARSPHTQPWIVQPSQLLWKLSDRARQFRQSHALTPEAASGHRGEDLAHRYLRGAGFLVVARNYRPGPDSEVDIVARRGGLLIFVEVKTRATAAFGDPARAIDPKKHLHILRAARSYLTRSGMASTQVRFDTISVILSNPPSIIHYEDSFSPARLV